MATLVNNVATAGSLHQITTAGSDNSIWYTWAGNVTTTSASTSIIWQTWAGGTGTSMSINNYGLRITAGSGVPQPVPQLTEEEIAAQRAERERQIAEADRRRAERERAYAEASARATALLQENLDERQKAEFAQQRAFTVISADGERTYRIRQGWSRNVDLMRDGKVVRTYCAHPHEQVPHEDNMLAQKLFLESDEQAFLRVAIAS